MNYETEISELHQFFQDWFTGKLPPTAFSRFSDAMAAGFHLIGPEGDLIDRETLISRLFAAHSTRQNIRIWVENVQLHQQHGSIAILTYEEWQQANEDKPVARISTVVFHDLKWLHVHETWL